MQEFLNRCHCIQCCDEQLYLHHERAIYWPGQRSLLVADVHFGKEHVFGRAGIAIPGGISQLNLDRLSRLVEATGAERLFILGDFMHAAPTARECWLLSLSQFLDQHGELAVQVITGNHDHRAGRQLVDPRISWLSASLVISPFVLQHEPADDARGYLLSGHLHPAFRLRAGAARGRGESLRAPAFWFRKQHAVLPAFGDFTGGHAIKPASGDHIYLCGPDCVLPAHTSGRELLH